MADLFGNQEVDDDEENDERQSNSLVGRYAEFLVCAQLCKAGYLATHVDGVGFDIIVTTEQGSFTIQVKSISTIKQGRCAWSLFQWTSNHAAVGKPRTHRNIRATDTDIVALYHHVYGTTIFLPVVGELPRNMSFSARQVEQADFVASLRSALDTLCHTDA